MVEGVELKRRSGTVTVLALLVGFLLSSAPSVAQSATDARSTSLGSPELVKRASILRTAARASSDDSEARIALPPPPAIVTHAAASRPAGTTSSLLQAGAPQPRVSSYRARAPPAI